MARFHHSFAPIFGNFPDPFSTRFRPVLDPCTSFFFDPFLRQKSNFSRPTPKKATSVIFDFCSIYLVFSNITKRPFSDCRLSPVKLFSIYIFLEYIYPIFRGRFSGVVCRFPTPFHFIFLIYSDSDNLYKQWGGRWGPGALVHFSHFHTIIIFFILTIFRGK